MNSNSDYSVYSGTLPPWFKQLIDSDPNSKPIQYWGKELMEVNEKLKTCQEELLALPEYEPRSQDIKIGVIKNNCITYKSAIFKKLHEKYPAQFENSEYMPYGVCLRSNNLALFLSSEINYLNGRKLQIEKNFDKLALSGAITRTKEVAEKKI